MTVTGYTKAGADSKFLAKTDASATYASLTSRTKHAPGFGLYFPEAEGAVGNGTADDSAALSACIAAAVAGKGETIISAGQTYKCESSITLLTNAKIRGEGPRALAKVIAGVGITANAVFLGSSGNAVQDVHLSGFTIDGSWTAYSKTISGVQITNGARPVIEDMLMRDFGACAVLCQGLSGFSGTPDAKIRRNVISLTGQADGSTGHAITIKDTSPNCQVTNNHISGAKGGMGVALYGTSGTGYPTNGIVSSNTITMAASTIGFECIGIATGCVGTVVSGNVCLNSQDNGISITPDRCTVTGNYIEQALNHGVASAGAYSTITGNVIRNVGKMTVSDGLTYGGVSLAGASYNTVTGNSIFDDQTTPTMANGVKFVTSAGHNVILGNIIKGQTGTVYASPASTDQIMDHNAYTDGPYVPKLHVDQLITAAASNLIIASATRAQSQFFVGSTGSGDGQLNVHTNTVTRPTVVAVKVASQTADLYQAVHEDATTVLASISRTGRVTGSDGLTTRYISGAGKTAAADGDFTVAPPDGTVAVVTNTTDSTVRFSVRAGGAWKTTAALS